MSEGSIALPVLIEHATAGNTGGDTGIDYVGVVVIGAGEGGAGRDSGLLDQGEVERALATLPEEFRLAVLLVDVEELTYEEAAEVLGCPVGTVRSRLARARRGLAVALRDYAAQSGYASRNS